MTAELGMSPAPEELEESREVVPAAQLQLITLELVGALCPALPGPVVEVMRDLAAEGAVTAAAARAESDMRRCGARHRSTCGRQRRSPRPERPSATPAPSWRSAVGLAT
jgi:hypothetical protein